MASAMPDSANSQLSRPARDEESDVLLPSLLHKGQLVVRNEGSVTRDYLGRSYGLCFRTSFTVAGFQD